MKTIRILIIGLIFIPNIALAQDYVGYYWTPELGIGFFREKIVLYKDSTFHWIFSGDLTYNETIGKYRIDKNIITLDIKPHYDTIHSWKRELGFELKDSSFLPSTPCIYDRDEKIPRKYFYKKNSLYIISKKGRKYRKPHFVRVDKDKWKRNVGVWIENGDSLRR